MKDWTDEWDVTARDVWMHVRRLSLLGAIVFVCIVAWLCHGCATPKNQVPEVNKPPVQKNISTISVDGSLYDKVLTVSRDKWQTLQNPVTGLIDLALIKEDVREHNCLLDAIETDYRGVYLLAGLYRIVAHSEDIWVDALGKLYIYQEFYLDYGSDGTIDFSSRRLLIEDDQGIILNQDDLEFNGYFETDENITEWHKQRYEAILKELLDYHLGGKKQAA